MYFVNNAWFFKIHSANSQFMGSFISSTVQRSAIRQSARFTQFQLARSVCRPLALVYRAETKQNKLRDPRPHNTIDEKRSNAKQGDQTNASAEFSITQTR